MVVITVVLSMLIILLMANLGSTPEPVYATFNVKALNNTALLITCTGGQALPLDTTRILVNGAEHNASGLDDRNGNLAWDAGEALIIHGLDLSSSSGVTVISGNTVLLSTDVEGVPAIITPSLPTPLPPVNWTLPIPPPSGPPSIPPPSTPPATYANGLVVTYYDNLNWTVELATANAPEVRYANLEASVADPLLGATNEYNWPATGIGRNTSFSVRFEGYILIDADDYYTFYLRSDDGSFMELDGAYIINNPNVGSDVETVWTGHLTPGYHPVRIYMFQGTGKSVVHLQYSTMMVAKQYVTQLYH